MKLTECVLGTFVTTDLSHNKGKIGIVKGITENPHGEAIPLVQWQHYSRELMPEHHSNLKIYKEKQHEV